MLFLHLLRWSCDYIWSSFIDFFNIHDITVFCWLLIYLLLLAWYLISHFCRSQSLGIFVCHFEFLTDYSIPDALRQFAYQRQSVPMSQYRVKWLKVWNLKLKIIEFESGIYHLLASPITSLERKKVKSLSCVQLFATPWTVAYQAPPSMGFSRQEYWSGLPFPSPGDLPDPGIKPWSPAL